MLVRFTEQVPATELGYSRRTLEDTVAKIDRVIERELRPQGGWFSSHPDQSTIEHHRATLRVKLDALGPLIPPKNPIPEPN